MLFSFSFKFPRFMASDDLLREGQVVPAELVVSFPLISEDPLTLQRKAQSLQEVSY